MSKRDLFTKLLAVAGLTLAWFPMVAAVLTSVVSTARSGVFRMDYLMPAELFPAALVGGILLLWAALRAGMHVRSIAWCLGLAAVFLVASQLIAVATGLASGETEPTGWPMVLVVGGMAGYTLALVGLGVSGALLARGVLRPAH